MRLNPTIRRARDPDDAIKLQTLAEATSVSITLADIRDRPHARLWVAELDASLLVGALLAWSVADELQIQQVATHPRFRRGGVGRALVSHALQRAKSNHLRVVLLEVRRGNEAALALYRNAGFVPVRVRPRYYSDMEDAIEMALELDAVPLAPKRQVVLPLLRRESMGQTYHVLTFETADEVPVAPGQFCMVRGADWGSAPLLPRPMSYLSGSPRPSILIKVVGEGTQRLARAEPGEPFAVLGPLGNRFSPPGAGRRPVLVAGGVGIAPLLFLARELTRRGSRPLAIYGARTERDLPLAEDLAEVADVEITTEDGSRGTRGRVTAVLEHHLAPDVQVYTCGPDRMMAAVAAMAAAHDAACEVSLETPMACGYGVCLGCPVPTTDGGYLYACTEGPCIDARRIDWSRETHAPKPAFRPPLPGGPA